jgi:glutamate formiminotransferase
MTAAAVFEAVPNFSEGREPGLLRALGAGPLVLDLHADADHHRSVVTMADTDLERLVEAVFEKVATAVERIDLRRHAGVHPRVGAADVVPLVPLGAASMDDAVAAARRLAERVWRELRVPVYLYGDATAGRRLADVRAGRAKPDLGGRPHPRAGAVCVGARPPLVAYNVVFERMDPGRARELVAAMRRLAGVQALAFRLPGDRLQLSMNLTRLAAIGVAGAHDAALAIAGRPGRPELVGLCPAAAAGPGCDGGILEARLAAAAARAAARSAAARAGEEQARLAGRLEAAGGALAALRAAPDDLLAGAEQAAALVRVLRAAGLADAGREALLGHAAAGLRAALPAATVARHARRVSLLDRWMTDAG